LNGRSTINFTKIFTQKGGEIRMLNQVVLTGNLGGDPEISFYGEGQQITSFNLAFSASKKKTGWIRVTCFSRLAEVAEKFLHKGARIAVVGSLDQRRWETDEGVQKSAFQLIAQSLEFIKTDGRGFTEEGSQPDDIPF
jgi:single-strand DNA-binding protein